MSILDGVEDKRHFRVSDEQSFGLQTGEKLYSLDDLSEAINLIEPDTFAFHVNEGKNDFAAWVKGVFGEEGLATQLFEHPTPLRMMVSIEKFLRKGETGNPSENPAPTKVEVETPAQ